MGCTGSKGRNKAVSTAPPSSARHQQRHGNTNTSSIVSPQDRQEGVGRGGGLEDGFDQKRRWRDERITALQEEARRQEEEKVKLLLLGTGESGKSTIFKQMRILYGSPLTDDDLRMYGVIVRSNIITAVRKLCMLARQLGYERRLDEESAAATASDLNDVSGMTPREAYDQIVTYLVDNSAAEPFPEIPQEQVEKDWVGRSTRAGIQANRDAIQFLQHVEAIRVLWQVSVHLSACGFGHGMAWYACNVCVLKL